MNPMVLDRPRSLQRLHSLPNVPNQAGRVYAISFDMDVDSLKIHYGDPYNNACSEFRKVLQKQGFNWRQGRVHFGGETINAVTCVLAAIELARVLPWFASSVRDIRMLRIEEFNDLTPAVQQVTGP
jgi:virulence-associated protein VapD